MNGVCFRCWGAGTEPYAPEEIEAWLVKARSEYRERREALKSATGKRANFLRAELVLLEKMGKAAKARLAKARHAITKRRSTKVARKPVAEFQSYTSDEVYEIHEAQDDGSLYCTCKAWKYQKKHPKERTCKHIEAFKRTRARKATSAVSDSATQLSLLQ